VLIVAGVVLLVAIVAGGVYWYFSSRPDTATTASVTDAASEAVVQEPAMPSGPAGESTAESSVVPVPEPSTPAGTGEAARLNRERLAAENQRSQQAQREARERAAQQQREQEAEAQRAALEEQRLRQEEQQRQMEESRRREAEEQQRREEQARLRALKEVPQGTQIAVRLIDAIDSSKNKEGDLFKASLDAPLTTAGGVLAPKGATAVVRLAAAKQSGTFRGRAELTVELATVTIDGQPVAFTTSSVSQQSGSQGAKTAKTAAAVGAVGAVLGGIFGGGKGAAIGAGAGAAAGAGSQVLLGGQRVRIPSETVLTFTTGALVTAP
jgi:hypothetical protein